MLQLDASAAADAIIRLLSDRSYWQQQSDLTYQSFLAYERQDFCTPWAALFRDLEEGACPDLPAPDPDEDQLLYQITRFHDQGMGVCMNRTRQLNARIGRLEAHLNVVRDNSIRGWAAKSACDVEIDHLKARMETLRDNSVRGWAAKSACDVEIDHLKAQMETLRDSSARGWAAKSACDAEIRQLKAQVKSLQADKSARDAEIAALKAECQKIHGHRQRLQEKLRRLRASSSYRLGRILTWPIRKLRKLLGR